MALIPQKLKNIYENFRMYGFQLGKPEESKTKEIHTSFAIPANTDGSQTVFSGGSFGTYVDLEGSSRNEFENINRYFDMACQPECDQAIQDIVTDAIVQEDNEPSVQLNLENLDVAESLKEDTRIAFEKIMEQLNFQSDGMEIFKRWYVAGRLHYHIIIDKENPHEGIQQLRYLEPTKIRRFREFQKVVGPNGTELVKTGPSYYIYNERGAAALDSTAPIGQRITEDSICYVHSGLIDAQRRMVVSYLHKAIKPLNQLRAIEDACVIYRLSRSAERRIFYIDVGNMPQNRADQYVQNVMNDFRNKLVYDSTTGEVRDDKKFLSMQEDIFLARREGGKGTEISTLPAGSNLNQIEDMHYFQERLYKSLHVPTSRLKSDQSFGMGRAAEISRDEIKFSRFIGQLRHRFEHLFRELLRVELLLTGVITEEDWKKWNNKITFDYQKDSVFTEAKDQEIWTARINLLQMFDPGQVVDRYVSRRWLKKNILKQSDEDITILEKEIKSEEKIAEEERQKEMELQNPEILNPGIGDK